MKKKLMTASLFVLASTGAFAQALPEQILTKIVPDEFHLFSGVNAGISMSSVSRSAKVLSDDSPIHIGKQAVVPALELGYLHALSPKVVLGLVAGYDLVDTKTGLSDGLELESKHQYSLNLKPGFVLGNSMLYGLVGYNRMQGTFFGFETGGTKSNYNGIGIGAGAEVMLNKNVYLKAEAQQMGYASTREGAVVVKPSAAVGALGVGYRF